MRTDVRRDEEKRRQKREKRSVRSTEVSRVEYKYSRDYKVTLFCFLLPISCDRTQKEAYYWVMHCKLGAYVCVCPWPLITSLRDPVRPRLVLCALSWAVYHWPHSLFIHPHREITNGHLYHHFLSVSHLHTHTNLRVGISWHWPTPLQLNG